jgi:hypothetical protein
VPVGAGQVAQRAAGLQADEAAEDLGVGEPGPDSEVDQLGADRVTPGGEAAALVGLYDHPVEGERQQRGIADPPGEPLGLVGRGAPPRPVAAP